MLSRLRLYNLYTNTAHARPVKQHFTQVAFNHCAINASGLHKIFASSTHSLKRLHIEYPMDLDGCELLRALRYVGVGLQELTVQGFSEQMEASDPPAAERLVDEILDACPNLVILNFPEAIGSKNLFDKLIGSKLELWSFSCNADVKPEDWLKALEHPDFPRPANCRVYATGEQISADPLSFDLCR